MVLASLLKYQFDCHRLSECFKIVPVLVKYTTLTIFENATVYIMVGFHEIQMTTIHIQLPKLLSNHLRIR